MYRYRCGARLPCVRTVPWPDNHPQQPRCRRYTHCWNDASYCQVRPEQPPPPRSPANQASVLLPSVHAKRACVLSLRDCVPRNTRGTSASGESPRASWNPGSGHRAPLRACSRARYASDRAIAARRHCRAAEARILCGSSRGQTRRLVVSSEIAANDPLRGPPMPFAFQRMPVVTAQLLPASPTSPVPTQLHLLLRQPAPA